MNDLKRFKTVYAATAEKNPFPDDMGYFIKCNNLYKLKIKIILDCFWDATEHNEYHFSSKEDKEIYFNNIFSEKLFEECKKYFCGLTLYGVNLYEDEMMVFNGYRLKIQKKNPGIISTYEII